LSLRTSLQVGRDAKAAVGQGGRSRVEGNGNLQDKNRN